MPRRHPYDKDPGLYLAVCLAGLGFVVLIVVGVALDVIKASSGG